MPRTPATESTPAEQGERHLRDFLKKARYLIQSADLQGRLLFVTDRTLNVLFLCTHGKYITGQTIRVDGGYSIS